MLALFILLMAIIAIAFRHGAFQSLLFLLRSASDDQRRAVTLTAPRCGWRVTR